MPSRRTLRRLPRMLLLAASTASAASAPLALPPRLDAAPPSPPAVPAAIPATGPTTLPGRQVLAGWATAGLFRLEATRYAAEEAPLPEQTKQKLIERVRRARGEVDALAAQYASGAVRSAAARKAVDGILARLGQDADALLGDRSAAFSRRVEKTMGEAQLFASHDPADARLLLDASAKPDDAQKARIDPILADAAARVKEIEAADRPDALALKHQIGFATRSAVRGLLTPEQQNTFDGPFDASQRGPAGPATTAAVASGAIRPPGPPGPQSRPGAPKPPPPAAGGPANPANPTNPRPPAVAAPGSGEAKVITLARLEAMRYAALEGPFPPEAKVSLAQRIAKGRADISENPVATGTAGADSGTTRIYTDVLADAAKLLKGQTAEFIRRQNRIYQEVSDLAGDGPWPGRAALEAVKLTPAQRSQVDQILARRAEQLKALTPTTLPALAPAPPAPGDAAADAAARSLRRREVAFQTRAALRAVLTPDQQTAWDAASP